MDEQARALEARVDGEVRLDGIRRCLYRNGRYHIVQTQIMDATDTG